MSITLKELTEAEEVRALEQLVLEYFRIISGELARLGVDLPPENPVADMMERLDNYVPPLGRAYIAAHGPDVLGMVFLKPLREQDVELKRLYVRDAARGSGLGRRLLHHTMDAARALGWRRMYLDTIKPLKPAIALYEAEGFEHVNAYDGSEVASHDAIRPHGVYMKRAL